MKAFFIGAITLNVLLICWLMAVVYGDAGFSYWTLAFIIMIAAGVTFFSHKPADRGCEYSADWGRSNER